MDSLQPGAIVQISNPEHPWFPALLIVSEVKTWGVQAYALMPQRNDEPASCSQAFNRLRSGDFEVVGTAAFVDR